MTNSFQKGRMNGQPPSVFTISGINIMEVQSILTILGFHICQFIYSLKFICEPQINTRGTVTVLWGSEKYEWPAEVRQNALFQYSYWTFSGSTECHIFCIFCFFFVIVVFKMYIWWAVQCSYTQEGCDGLIKNTGVLDMLRSGPRSLCCWPWIQC